MFELITKNKYEYHNIKTKLMKISVYSAPNVIYNV